MRIALRGGRFVVHTAVVIGLLVTLFVAPAHAHQARAQQARAQQARAQQARAQTSDAFQVLSLVNSTRASVGAPPVSLDATLSTIAQTWAGVMALAGTILHNPTLGVQVLGWTLLAENVGQGGSLDIVHQTLLASPAHYSNMTNPRFTSAGAGVVPAGGQVYVVQIFMEGQAGPASPPPPPVADPEPEPDPEPWVAPVQTYQAPAREVEPEPVPVTNAPEPVPSVQVIPVVATPLVAAEASPWMALSFERLADLDRVGG